MRRVNVWLQDENASVMLPHQRLPAPQRQEVQKFGNEDWQVIVDGSCDAMGRAGCAHLMYKAGELRYVAFTSHILNDPFHAEVLAVKEALLFLKGVVEMNQGGKIMVYSDCQILVYFIHEGEVHEIPSWRAAEEVMEIINVTQELAHRVSVKWVQREAVRQAHMLANRARSLNQSFTGNAVAAQGQMDVSFEIDERFFQRVQDEPP